MQRSNTYILVFTAIMTVIIGGILSFTSQVLGPAQKKSIELDTKTQILSAVMDLGKKDDVLGIYNKSIQSMVVDIDGNEVEKDKKGNPIVAEEVNIVKNYKMKPGKREYRQVMLFYTTPCSIGAILFEHSIWQCVILFMFFRQNFLCMPEPAFGLAVYAVVKCYSLSTMSNITACASKSLRCHAIQ